MDPRTLKARADFEESGKQVMDFLGLLDETKEHVKRLDPLYEKYVLPHVDEPKTVTTGLQDSFQATAELIKRAETLQQKNPASSSSGQHDVSSPTRYVDGALMPVSRLSQEPFEHPQSSTEYVDGSIGDVSDDIQEHPSLPSSPQNSPLTLAEPTQAAHLGIDYLDSSSVMDEDFEPVPFTLPSRPSSLRQNILD